MGDGTEDEERLLDEDISGRHYLPVLVLVPPEKNLHGQAAPAAVSVGVAEDPEVNILPTEDLKSWIVLSFIYLVAHPAFLHGWLDVVVLAALHIHIGI